MKQRRRLVQFKRSIFAIFAILVSRQMYLPDGLATSKTWFYIFLIFFSFCSLPMFSLILAHTNDYIPKERIDSDTTYRAKQVNKQVTTKYGQVVDQDEYYEYAYDSGSSSYVSSSNYGNRNSVGGTAQSSGGVYLSYDSYYDIDYDQYTTQVPRTTASTTSTTTTTTTTPYFACKLILFEKTHFR